MRAAIFAALLSSAAQAQWVESTIHGARTDQTTHPIVLYVNVLDGQTPGPTWCYTAAFTTAPDLAGWCIPWVPVQQWATVDLSAMPGLPADATHVRLVGELIITRGLTPPEQELCRITAAFRAPGSTLPGNHYVAHAVDGTRTNWSTLVPVVDRKFEVYIHVQPALPYPQHCALGLSARVQEYWR